ncbi:Serine/arginine-rich SC35-like splicing factor SCL30A [Actinidia chinensis var. chinensis]|uniref:Serine/arginine-rich SC35-like splicing factor SCL30A n=1 Tax=Actinidia chinensis var. chinensis TaxID=1590841 RepID=A0A2R6R5D0_ACTCC|nr:Serine/arginine-rich SC35-like splicing factor SCL30A [Actinidia chinensis var. chinensis]
MGNCQTAEAATVIIQHPGDKVERIYGSVSAHEVMYSNPGHYVALVFTSPAEDSNNGAAAKRLKLIRPGDTLLMGQVYRLISFEDVLKVFAEKKSVKLAKLLERGGFSMEKTKPSGGPTPTPNPNQERARSIQAEFRLGSSSSRVTGKHNVGGGQWKPALQSIEEVGT